MVVKTTVCPTSKEVRLATGVLTVGSGETTTGKLPTLFDTPFPSITVTPAEKDVPPADAEGVQFNQPVPPLHALTHPSDGPTPLQENV